MGTPPERRRTGSGHRELCDFGHRDRGQPPAINSGTCRNDRNCAARRVAWLPLPRRNYSPDGDTREKRICEARHRRPADGGTATQLEERTVMTTILDLKGTLAKMPMM